MKPGDRICVRINRLSPRKIKLHLHEYFAIGEVVDGVDENGHILARFYYKDKKHTFGARYGWSEMGFSLDEVTLIGREHHISDELLCGENETR